MNLLKKRGRKPGGAPIAGGWNEWLCSFEVGERRYLESSPETHGTDLVKCVPPVNRRLGVAKGWEFRREVMTACSHHKVATRLLICVERIA